MDIYITKCIRTAICICVRIVFTHSFRRYADLNGLEVSSLCTGDYGPNFALANVTANVKVGKKRFLLRSLFHPELGCTLGKRNQVINRNSNSGNNNNDDEDEDEDENDD